MKCLHCNREHAPTDGDTALSILQEVLGDKPDKWGYFAAYNVMDDALRYRARNVVEAASCSDTIWYCPECDVKFYPPEAVHFGALGEANCPDCNHDLGTEDY